MIYDVLLKPKNTDGNKEHKRLLYPVASAIVDYEDTMEELQRELDPFTTKQLLPEWEKELGIPDGCIAIADTIEERRANVLFKLFAINIESAYDIILLAEKLNINIEVKTARQRCAYPVKYPVPYINVDCMPFVFFIQYLDFVEQPNRYPAKYPIPYTRNENVKAFECLVLKSMPPNYFVVFENAAPPNNA